MVRHTHFSALASRLTRAPASERRALAIQQPVAVGEPFALFSLRELASHRAHSHSLASLSAKWEDARPGRASF